VTASEVVWIGDTWIIIPGNQHTRVEELARAQGAIGTGDSYVVLAAPYASIDDIVAQYESRQAGATKVKALIMDGGTWDTIRDDSPASVGRIVDTFEQFLGKIADDGTVEHVIYFLVPELPAIPGVAALRPGFRAACASSVVPCHFLDLQALWLEHPEYTASDGVQASEAGADVIATAIWELMRAQCIAQ
jgi:hypothetical protein